MLPAPLPSHRQTPLVVVLDGSIVSPGRPSAHALGPGASLGEHAILARTPPPERALSSWAAGPLGATLLAIPTPLLRRLLLR